MSSSHQPSLPSGTAPGTPSISRSRSAAAVVNALVSILGLVVSIAPLPLGAASVSAAGDDPPFAILVAGVVLGVLGLVGSFGVWRAERWGVVLVIVVRGLDGVSSLAGVFATSTTLRTLAIVSVVSAVVVIVLLLRREGSADTTAG